MRLAPERPASREDVARQLELLLPVFTPRTVFMEIGSRDGALGLRAAGYVERVWCVDTARDTTAGARRAPCNLRWSSIGGMPLDSVDVAFSEGMKSLDDVVRLLKRGGVYFVYGQLLPAQPFREAGFSRVQYYLGGHRVPGALARIASTTTTAAWK